MELAALSAETLDLSYGTVRTLAGHDSTNMKVIMPTVMFFVPSVEGILHNEKELTCDGDMLAGVDLFIEVLSMVVGGACE